MLSFDTEEEELNIATRADTMMTALSPPSSCSITNGRVCSFHIQWANRQRHYTLHKLPLLLRVAPPSETSLKAPRRRKQIQKSTRTPWRLILQSLLLQRFTAESSRELSAFRKLNNKQRQVSMFLILLFKLLTQFPFCLFSLYLSLPFLNPLSSPSPPPLLSLLINSLSS